MTASPPEAYRSLRTLRTVCHAPHTRTLWPGRESVAGSLTMDDPRDLRRLHRIFGNLSRAALDPDKSRDLIACIKNKED